MWTLLAAAALAAPDVPACDLDDRQLPCVHEATGKVDRWGMPTQGLDARSPMLDLCADGGDCGMKRTSDFLLLGSGLVGVGAAATWGVPPNGIGIAPYEWEPAIAWGGAVGGTYLLTAVMKSAASRPRPYTYSPAFAARSPDERGKADHRHSFFSGHTSLVAANLFYTATSTTLYAPRGADGYKTALYGVAVAGTAATGFARVRAGKHFASDVIAGALVGAAMGIAAPVVTAQLRYGQTGETVAAWR